MDIRLVISKLNDIYDKEGVCDVLISDEEVRNVVPLQFNDILDSAFDFEDVIFDKENRVVILK